MALATHWHHVVRLSPPSMTGTSSTCVFRATAAATSTASSSSSPPSQSSPFSFPSLARRRLVTCLFRASSHRASTWTPISRGLSPSPSRYSQIALPRKQFPARLYSSSPLPQTKPTSTPVQQKSPISPSPEKGEKKPLLSALKQLTPHENVYTLPNILTFSRLIAAPVVGYLVLHDQHAWAIGLFAYAGITDLVDGWIARKWNLQTVVGTVIDPMADKTLMTILTVCLAIKGTMPIWLAGIILGRDVGLAMMAIYYRWISLPPPKTFSRYWDFSLPSAEVHPTTISKYNTALQLALIGATTAMPLVTVDVTAAMTAMQYLVATTTIWSGASYLWSKDAVKILNQQDKKEKK